MKRSLQPVQWKKYLATSCFLEIEPDRRKRGLIGILLFSIASTLLLGACAAYKGWGKQFPGRYKEYLNPGEEEVYSSYQKVVTKTAAGKYIERVFFPETRQILELTEYRDKKLKIKEGLYVEWYDNGNKKALGKHKNNLRSGVWEVIADEDLSGDPPREAGETVSKLRYNDAGRLMGSYTFDRNNKRHGLQIDCDSFGHITSSVMYKHGEMDESYIPYDLADRTGSLAPVLQTCLDKSTDEDKLKCTKSKLQEFLDNNLRYPQRARMYGVQGLAVITITIEADGKISGTKILRGVSEDIAHELQRLVEIMPEWQPALEAGRPVKKDFTMTVRFSLN